MLSLITSTLDACFIPENRSRTKVQQSCPGRCEKVVVIPFVRRQCFGSPRYLGHPLLRTFIAFVGSRSTIHSTNCDADSTDSHQTPPKHAFDSKQMASAPHGLEYPPLPTDQSTRLRRVKAGRKPSAIHYVLFEINLSDRDLCS